MGEFETIRAKRRASTIEALRGKALIGKTHGKERALVRCGVGTTKVLIGMDDLSDWDEEELRRGRRRDKNGRFVGRDPVIVPKQVHDELVRRTMRTAQEILRQNLVAAVEVLTEIVQGVDVEPKDKLKAIQMIMDRTMGREPQTVVHQGEAKWQIALEDGIVSMPKALEDPYMDDRDRGTLGDLMQDDGDEDE